MVTDVAAPPATSKWKRWSSTEEAVEVVRSGDRVFVQGASAFPQILIDALVKRGEEGASSALENVEIVHLHTNG